jgi:hypothetical protein
VAIVQEDRPRASGRGLRLEGPALATLSPYSARFAPRRFSLVSGIDTRFGLDSGTNLHRGYQHHCIYCDSRSLCYGNDRFDEDVLVKSNAIDVLRNELRLARGRPMTHRGRDNVPFRGPQFPLSIRTGRVLSEVRMTLEDTRCERR